MNAYAAIDQREDRLQVQADVNGQRIEYLSHVFREEFRESGEIKSVQFDTVDIQEKLEEEFEQLVIALDSNDSNHPLVISIINRIRDCTRTESETASYRAAEQKVETENKQLGVH